MAIQKIKLEFIFDNPYNPRSHYNPDKIKDLASSIEQNGLLEIPRARQLTPESYELAYGGYRLRAFKLLAKKNAENWGEMPLDIVDVSDTSMAIFALEENLKRHDMTPMETANAIDKYFTVFPETREEDLATKLSMTQGNLSNMRRVTKLPKEVLKYINDETINFTMGRELCTLIDITGTTKGAVDAKLVMIDAINLVGTNEIPSTVIGMRKAINRAVKAVVSDGRLREVNKETPAANPPVFDTTLCNKCPKCLKTTDDLNKNAYTCLDIQCWDLNQTNAKRKIQEAKEAAEKAAMEAEAATKPAENISQEIKTETAVKKPEPLVFYVDPTRLKKRGDIHEAFSAPQIINGNTINAPFDIDGEKYISVGDYQNMPGAKRAYRLVPKEEYTKEIRSFNTPEGMNAEEYRNQLLNDPCGPYNGAVAKWQDKEFVSVGPEVIFAPKEETATTEPAPAVPVTTSSTFDKATEIPVGGDEQESEEEDTGDELETEEETGEENTAGTTVAEAPTKNIETPEIAPVAPPVADMLYIVSLTMPVIISNSSALEEGEQKHQAWLKFKEAIFNDAFSADNLKITKA